MQVADLTQAFSGQSRGVPAPQARTQDGPAPLERLATTTTQFIAALVLGISIAYLPLRATTPVARSGDRRDVSVISDGARSIERCSFHAKSIY